MSDTRRRIAIERSRGRQRQRPPDFPIIPMGAWPRRMPEELAAGYVGERTVKSFLRRVGREYPRPRVKEGRRQLWLRDDLDRAIVPNAYPVDAAEDL